MQAIRDALETIVQLADDTSWSHAARMVKIKGIAAQALSDLGDKQVAEAKPKVGRPPKGKTTDGAKTGDGVSDPGPAAAAKATL